MESEIEMRKDVVIIGNGPSAITLSYLLSGNWPYFKPDSTHSNEFLSHRLRENLHQSLVERDLESLSSGLEGRSSNPVSLLFDALNHPDADLGIENESLLSWRKNCDKEIDHVVLGRGLPGGCWQDMEGGILTISLGSWMELPDWSFREWETQSNGDKSTFRQGRATVGSVARYYQDYAKQKGLAKYFVNCTIVHSVIKDERTNSWLVRARRELKNHETGESRVYNLKYRTPNVVLATGISDIPNRLNVPGEELDFVIHALRDLEKLIANDKLTPHKGNLLIIGAGLSAADAIIAAKFHRIPIIHAFRRRVDDSALIFNKLPHILYPEYRKVYQIMRDGQGVRYQRYKSHPGYEVAQIRPNRTVILKPVRSDEGSLTVKVSYVAVLIGKKPDLSFLPNEGKNLGLNPSAKVDPKRNPLAIDPYTHQSLSEPGIFATGPLVGDNFVRFVQGGALAVANYLNKSN